MDNILRKIDNFFKVTKDGSTIETEIFSGITAYFTMVYLLFLVPSTIMNAFPGAHGENGQFLKDAVLSGGVRAGDMLVVLTVMACLTAGIGTLILAFYANLPFAQGPSLAIATFVTYTICVRMGYTYNEALAAIFLSGVIFFLIILMGLEKKIQDAIPTNIKFAVTAGIGIFIAFIGMQKAYIVESNPQNLVQLVNFTAGDANSKSALLCLFAVIATAVMLIKHVHGAVLWGKILCIVAAIPLGLVHLSEFEISFESIMLASREALKMDFAGLFTPHMDMFGLPGAIISVLIIISTLCVMDVFETMGTIIATDYIISVSREGNLSDKFDKVLKSDAISTSIGATMGMTNVSTYVESTTMIVEGGRTGLSAVVTAVLFFCTIFIAPVASAIPPAASGTTLIMSGILMMNVMKYINFEDMELALPAFLTVTMIPLTYSIVSGIALGLISHVLIMLFLGKKKQIKLGTVVMAIIFAIQFLMIQ